MTYRGVVKGGVVVLKENAGLPEGAEVEVSPAAQATSTKCPSTSLADMFAELIRMAESTPCNLPEDLAANHDHYLHANGR